VRVTCLEKSKNGQLKPERHDEGVKQFNTPQNSFKGLKAEGTATLIAAATDIALVIDADGIIQDLSLRDDDLPSDDYEGWINKPWIETVTVESRPKVEALLDSALSGSTSNWRHINHPSSRGPDLPILYATAPIGSDGKMLAIGRSAVVVAELQQKLLQAQQSMERNYLQIRHLETRYRLLFQVSSEAVFIVDAANKKVVEANPAAEKLLGEDGAKLPGQKFTKLFSDSGNGAVENFLGEVRSTGRRTQVKAQLAGQGLECVLSASLFSQNGGSLYLISVNPLQERAEEPKGSNVHDKLLKLMEKAPDGFVLTGADGIILDANQAFIELTETGSEERVLGESLDRWFGRSGVDLNVLTANLRKHGSVRLFATTLRGEYGSSVDVEVSATKLVMSDDDSYFGFIIRDIGLRLENNSRKQSRLARPVEQLTELVGRLPLRDLVQESTNMVERYCIEAALEITGENRTSAAEILGLSRQSLYVKLRRYGLGDNDSETSE